jgi:glucose-6-phosphate dehydrogenase assembly protein OpcA
VAQDLTALPVARSVAEIEARIGAAWGSRRALAAAGDEAAVAARSSVSNLVVVAGRPETAQRCAAVIAATARRHPSRSLILSAADPDGPAGLEARVEALTLPTPSGRSHTGAETVYVTARGETGRHLASIIVPLLVHDLPVALWWPGDPSFHSHRAERLVPLADRLIVDGSEWPGDGLDRLSAMAEMAGQMSLPVADFSLLRQARWREALASVYDLPDLRPHLRSVRAISVEFAYGDHPSGLANVVRPVYHVAWLASRLGMSVVSPLRRDGDGRGVAVLRQDGHSVTAEWRPAPSGLGAGSTVRVEIVSRRGGSELVGVVTADDSAVYVTVQDGGRERIRRVFSAPRLTEVDLLERAMDDRSGDRIAAEALAMAGRLLADHPTPGPSPAPAPTPRGTP